MNITNEARDYFAPYVGEAGAVHFYAQAGCCGVQVGVRLLQQAEEVSIINDVRVVMDAEVVQQLEHVTVDVEEQDGQIGLALIGYEASSC